MGYEIKKLRQIHYIMVNHVLQGWTGREIAKKLGRSEYGVSLIMKSRVFQEEFARRRREQNARMDEQSENAREVLERAGLGAAKKQIKLLDSQNEIVQLRAAQDILNRAGLLPTQRVEEKRVIIQLKGSDIERMKEAHREAFGTELDFDLEGEE